MRSDAIAQEMEFCGFYMETRKYNDKVNNQSVLIAKNIVVFSSDCSMTIFKQNNRGLNPTPSFLW